MHALQKLERITSSRVTLSLVIIVAVLLTLCSWAPPTQAFYNIYEDWQCGDCWATHCRCESNCSDACLTVYSPNYKVMDWDCYFSCMTPCGQALLNCFTSNGCRNVIGYHVLFAATANVNLPPAVVRTSAEIQAGTNVAVGWYELDTYDPISTPPGSVNDVEFYSITQAAFDSSMAADSSLASVPFEFLGFGQLDSLSLNLVSGGGGEERAGTPQVGYSVTLPDVFETETPYYLAAVSKDDAAAPDPGMIAMASLVVTAAFPECDCLPDWAAHGGGAPPARNAHASAYDPINKELVIFGGSDGVTGLDDTWVWTGNSWQERLPVTRPPGRSSAAMAFDQNLGGIVLHGGHDGTSPVSDTWLWNGTNWSDVSSSPALASYAAGMAFDPLRNVLVLYGGTTATGRSPATWEFDGTSWSNVSGSSPPGYRSGHAMEFDSLNGRIHMYGGQTPGGVETQDNWGYDGTWVNLGTGGPSARHHHRMAYQSGCGRLRVYGGYKDGTTHDDYWEWDGAAWSMLSTGSDPGPLYGSSLDYFPGTEDFLIFGGYDGLDRLAATWQHGCDVDAVGAQFPPATITESRFIVSSPNPFEGSTAIRYQVDRRSPVSLEVYDVAGRLIRTLAKSSSQSAGVHSVTWDGHDGAGARVGSGIFFVRLETNDVSQTERVVHIR